MNNYTVYMHKNKINGKVYIGQTCQKPEYRWNNGQHYYSCPIFQRAINKYGWDNFEHIILLTGLSKEQANIEEKRYIEEYNATNENFGYNCQSGRDNHTVNEKSKQKSKENSIRMWQDPSHREKISAIMKEKWQDEEYRTRIANGMEKARNLHEQETGSRCFMTEDGKKRVSEARKEYMNSHKDKYCHKVKCLNTGMIFNSYVEAAAWAGLKDSSGFSKYFSPNNKGRHKTLGKHPETQEKLEWEKIDNG